MLLIKKLKKNSIFDNQSKFKVGDKVILRSKTMHSCSSVIDEVSDVYESKNLICLKGYKEKWFDIDNGYNQWVKAVEIE